MFCLTVVPATLIAMPFQSAALGPAKTVAALPLLAAISFVLFITAFSIYAYGCAAIVGQLILKPLPWLIAAAALSAIWLVLRRKHRSHWGHEPFTFADDGDPTVQVTNFAPE